MKKLLVIPILVFIFGCSEGKKSESNTENQMNSEEHVDANSGENISPQLEYDSTGRADVDSISSTEGIERQTE